MDYFISSGNYITAIYVIFGIFFLTFIFSKIADFFDGNVSKNYSSFIISAIKETSPEERKIIKDFLIDIGIVKDESR